MAFAAEQTPAPRGRMIASIILFLLLMGATPALVEELGIDGIAVLPFFLPALAALGWMAREVMLFKQSQGCATRASMAYTRRMMPLSAGYVVALLAAITVHDHYGVDGPALYALAILPALPLIGIVWAMGRFLIEEEDEYQRAQVVRQSLIATGFMLVVVTIYGFLEDFGLVPHLPAYWAFILWCLGLGIGNCVNKLRS